MRYLNKKLWPYRCYIKLGNDAVMQHIQMEDWCIDRIGIKSTEWYSYEIRPLEVIYAFRNGENASMFRLTWG
jgi:hypothetical protein